MSLFRLTILVILSSVGASAYAQDQAEARPNFIIIFADDLGYGDLGVYGNPNILTPNLDRMAMEGQKWTNFYVGASVCTPSRAAIMTGRLPVRSGMASSKVRVLFPDSHHGLPQDEITLAEQLRSGGYATACIGKWHLGHKSQYLPTNNGFDSYFGIPYSNDMDNLTDLESVGGYYAFWKTDASRESATFNVPLLRDTTVVERPADQTTITKRYSEAAVKYIKETEGPFFLYLAHNLPHVPLFVSDDFKGKSKRGLYGDVVSEIDDGVGRIVEALQEKGIAENTIVVFTSDNGPWLTFGIDGGSAGPLRMGKGSTWEGGMREPCIFWSPGNLKPGTVTELGTTMDLFTTFSSMAGIALPDDRIIDGVDLSPVLKGRGGSPREQVFYYRGNELYAVRVGQYKLHLITQGAYGQGQGREVLDAPLLFDLNTDPEERFDVSALHPEVIERIRGVIKEHQAGMVMGEDMLKDRG